MPSQICRLKRAACRKIIAKQRANVPIFIGRGAPQYDWSEVVRFRRTRIPYRKWRRRGWSGSACFRMHVLTQLPIDACLIPLIDPLTSRGS
jgi:hypothetical protein